VAEVDFDEHVHMVEFREEEEALNEEVGAVFVFVAAVVAVLVASYDFVWTTFRDNLAI